MVYVRTCVRAADSLDGKEKSWERQRKKRKREEDVWLGWVVHLSFHFNFSALVDDRP